MLSIYNLTGQVLFTKRISDSGYYEFNPGFKDGIYIVSFASKIYEDSRKIFIREQMISAKISDYWFRIILTILLGSDVIHYPLELKAQEPPPRPIRINATAQSLSFGAFYHGASEEP